MIPNWLSWLDVSFMVAVLLFAWGGYQKGFAAQLAPLLTFAASCVLLFFAYPFLFSYFGKVFRNLEETYLMWMLLITLLVLGIALFILFSKLLAGLLKLQISERADQVWGFVFGSFRGVFTVLLALIILVMVDRTGGSYDRLRAKSQVGKLVCYKVVPVIQPRLTALYENKISDWKTELLKRDEAGDIDSM
ncbi:CvpA family protein [Pontiellaceae bacterium B1224]|nr:CvpA family protein [Pontiellaceae bacterium B1224]